MKRVPIPKRRSKPRRGRVVDKAFMAWMHTQPCLVRGLFGTSPCSGPITFHHLRSLGGQKNDQVGLPLCEAHHLHDAGPDAIHRLGKWRFAERFALDLDLEARKYRQAYVAAGGVLAFWAGGKDLTSYR